MEQLKTIIANIAKEKNIATRKTLQTQLNAEIKKVVDAKIAEANV